MYINIIQIKTVGNYVGKSIYDILFITWLFAENELRKKVKHFNASRRMTCQIKRHACLVFHLGRS